MRIFEILAIVAVIFSAVNHIFVKRIKLGIASSAASVLFCIVNLIFEGYRSQMVPSYLLALVLLLITVINLLAKPYHVKKGLRITGISVLILSLIISAALPVLLPVVKLPAPEGPYSVGTVYMSFADKSRKGIFTGSDQYREIAVQVWYPAEDIQDKQKVTYFPDIKLAPYLAERLGIPNLFDQIALVKTHSYLDAGLSQKESKYPIVLFSGGYGGFAAQNTIQMEALASQGYVVFGISHPYEEFGTIFPGGKLVRFDTRQVNTFQNELLHIGDDYKGDLLSPDFEKYAVRNSPIAYNSVRIWSDDTRFIADEIEKLNSGEIISIFQNKLDISNMGVFGHSFGGATAGQVCLEDNRFKAFINMDGTPFGDVVDNIIKQPFMIMTGDADKNLIKAGYSEQQTNYLNVTINGAKHADFMDFTVLLPSFRHVGMLGSIGGSRQEKIMNDYVTAFFNKHLKEASEPLIDERLSQYAEATIEAK